MFIYKCKGETMSGSNILGGFLSVMAAGFVYLYGIKHPEVMDQTGFRCYEYIAFLVVFAGVGFGTLFREFLGCPGDTEDPKRERR